MSRRSGPENDRWSGRPLVVCTVRSGGSSSSQTRTLDSFRRRCTESGPKPALGRDSSIPTTRPVSWSAGCDRPSEMASVRVADDEQRNVAHDVLDQVIDEVVRGSNRVVGRRVAHSCQVRVEPPVDSTRRKNRFERHSDLEVGRVGAVERRHGRTLAEVAVAQRRVRSSEMVCIFVPNCRSDLGAEASDADRHADAAPGHPDSAEPDGLSGICGAAPRHR